MSVLIKKEGFFYKEHLDVEDSFAEKEIREWNFVRFLREECSIAKDVTLRDVMINVSRNKNLTKFLSEYSKIDIENFNKFLSFKEKENEDIAELVVMPVLEDYDKNLLLYFNFSGISKNLQFYSLTGVFENILDKIIKIDLRTLGTDDFEYVEKISFIDFLDAIYWEIGFYGSPENSKKLIEELKERVKIYENKKEQGIEKYYIPYEDLAEKLNFRSDICEKITESISKKEDIIYDNFECFLWNHIIKEKKEILMEDVKYYKKYYLICKLNRIIKLISEDMISLDEIVSSHWFSSI